MPDYVTVRELERLLAAHKRRQQFRKRFRPVFVSAIILLFVLYWNSSRPLTSIFELMYWLGIILVVAADVGLGGRIDGELRKIEESGYVRALGPCALALRQQQVDQKLVTRILASLLPRLKPTDKTWLTSEHLDALISSLKRPPRKNSAYFIAVLGAFEQLGDPEALPAVQALADRVRGDRHLKHLSEAAEECLETLRAPYEQKLQRETLVRASEAGLEVELLRPASSRNEEQAAQLLRSDSAE